MKTSLLALCPFLGRSPVLSGGVAFCLAVMLVSQLAAAAPDSGLLGHWRFEQGQGDVLEDSSGKGNPGDLLGGEWARGEFGTALHFTGADSCAVVPQLDGLDGSNELTVEAWALWEAGGRYPNILTAGQWCPGGFMFFVSDTSCSFRMGRPGAAAGEPAPPWQECSAPLIGRFETGKWYHLAATFKRPAITTYVNGQKVGSAQWDYPVGYQGDLVIGQWGSSQVCHQGLIDEVKLYNRALSAEEIGASYTGESPRRSAAKPTAYQRIPATPQIAVTIENPLVKLQLDARGRGIALIEKSTGRNLLAKALPIATLQVPGRTLRPTACTFADGQLRLQFNRGEAQALIGCAAKDKYLTFTVQAVEGRDVESLSFLTLVVQPGKYASDTSGAVTDDDWGVCLRAMNLQTEVRVSSGPPTLRANCAAEYGLVGSKAGLVVAAAADLRPALQELVRAEGLPQSALGGPWALDAEGIRGSYLFAHPSERDAERWIDLAKRGGFTHLHYDGWYKSLGHYEPNPNLFPNGLEGLKTMIRKVHEAGLKAGMHTLTGCIQPTDPWVTPVPDKRLAADASYTLAADMDEKSDTILTVEKPQPHDVIWSYSGRGNAIRIGDEIIQYAAISFTPPYGFLKCTRGAFQTKPGAHRKDDRVDHLRQVYIAFYPEERSTLVDEVAEAIARVYNECEFDQIYMDGSEGMGKLHAIQTMRNAIYQRLKRPTVVEASCWDHWSWYYHSRIGAWDHPKWGLKPFTDMHCAAIANYRRGALLQAQLGWWVVLGPSAASRAETPDEMEYFCCKTLAFDAPSSTQGIGSLTAPANARMQEYLTRAGWYERLRLANYFPESVKEQLRQPGKDFHLVQDDDGQWQFLPTDYLAHKVTGLDNGTGVWTVNNQFQAQPLKLRLEALYSVAPYDSPDSVLVADAASLDQFTVRRTASGVTQTLQGSTEQVKAGDASLRFAATNQRPSARGAWAHAGMRFEAPYFSITPCDALGVWIHGDGKGEVLNLQLSTPREYMQAYGEHYVTIDFTGWRYFEIPLRERDAARHRDYEWPYASLGGIYMTAVNRNHVGEVNLYLNNVPPGETATVYLSPIKALRTSRVPLANPAIALNGQQLSLPVTLHSGDYVELAALDDCRVYDERGTLLQRLTVPGEAPVLKAGENRLAFTCGRPEGYSARAELTAIACGPPLAERAPADQIQWQLLRDEYDAPRVVTKLDGHDNAWEVRCRKGEKAVPFGVEIDVEQMQASDAAYLSSDTLPLEGFDDEAFFGDASSQPAAAGRYEEKNRSSAALPGVTQTLERSTEQVKFGKASARYSATSTLANNGGWSVRGARFLKPLDLSRFQALGFWLYGDGRGEAFKLQLHDKAGGWCDMVTHVNFTGWRYQQFEFSGPGKLDRAQVTSLLIYYNSIPAKQTVTCYVDEIRAVPELAGLRNPTLTIGDQRLVFPAELSNGDRLVFDGSRCRLHRRAKPDIEWIQPQGGPATLDQGRHRAELSFDADLLPHFRVAVSLVKHYGAEYSKAAGLR